MWQSCCVWVSHWPRLFTELRSDPVASPSLKQQYYLKETEQICWPGFYLFTIITTDVTTQIIWQLLVKDVICRARIKDHVYTSKWVYAHTHKDTHIHGPAKHIMYFLANGSHGWWLSWEGVSTTPSSVWGKTTTTISSPQPNLQPPQERENICVCMCVPACTVRCVKKPLAPPYYEPSPNHNKPETNSEWNCNTLRVWISPSLRSSAFFSPRGKMESHWPCAAMQVR